MEPANLDIKKFSSHIFWDVDVNNLDIIRSKKLIVQRVLGYGLINDWKILLNLYGIAEIAETAVSLRDLDNKSVLFQYFLKYPKNNSYVTLRNYRFPNT